LVLHVVTVRTGDKYPESYEIALRKQVYGHLGKPLVVLREQRYPFEGYWSKIELFSPEFEFRPCLFFDLDTFIMDDIRDMLFEPESLWLIRDFNNPETRSNSGIMMIPEDTESIWENSKKWTRNNADGDFLNTQPHEKIQDHFHGVYSYKRHCKVRPNDGREQSYPADARVICFHGHPRPHEATDWAGERWQKLIN